MRTDDTVFDTEYLTADGIEMRKTDGYYEDNVTDRSGFTGDLGLWRWGKRVLCMSMQWNQHTQCNDMYVASADPD